MSAHQVKAMTFDVFGTVVDWRSSIIDQFQAFGEERGLSIPWDAFIDEWKSCYRPGMDAVNSGKLPWTRVDEIYRKRLDELLMKYDIGGLSEAEKLYLNHAWHRLNPWPDVADGLKRLKKHFILSTLSNSDFACMVNMTKRAGLPWDCLLCAEIFRRYKPAPEVYLGAIRLLGCRPEEVMMVASHNYDLRNARSHGMRTAFVPRPLEYGPGQTSNLEPEADWDVIATDFEDFAAAMNA